MNQLQRFSDVTASGKAARTANGLVLLLLVLTSTSGCTQANYNARNLPPQYIANKFISARHVDLTNIRRNSPPYEWLQPSDEVEVSIATGIENNAVPKWDLAVDQKGQLDVPLVGVTPVAGITPTEAAERIRFDAIRRGLYVDPKVTVSLKKKRTFQVTVIGAVNKPDTYEIPASNCDLLTAITMAEGIADDASRYLQIRHSPAAINQLASREPLVGPGGVALASFKSQPPQPVLDLDIAQLSNMPADSLQLYDGSVVNVRREPKRYVSVQGLVRTPKQVEMPDGEDLTLLDAIAAAGGATLSVADKVYITRTLPDSETSIVIKASLSDARSGGKSNLRLAHGDAVSVAETPPTVVIQAIQTFFRVGFNAGFPGL
jgi:polysaccharide biosynthesis/export protein